MHRGKGMKFVGDSRVLAPESRKPMLPKDYSEYPGKTEAFWPNFLLKEWMVGAVFLVGFLCLTVAHPAPLERIADPTDTSYIPLPDWYFLFLYQLLKYSFASGPYTIVGAMIIPGLAFGGLLLAPFLDRGPERRARKRPLATGFMLLALAAIVFLTWQSVSTHDWAAAERQGKIVPKADINKADPGYEVFKAQGCINCHGENLQGGAGAPSLIGTGLSADEVSKIAKDGKGKMPAGIFKGNDQQLKQLSDFISGLGKK
ncbi:menaquinol-cytochrome c reductase cytochrome b/c subunit [Neobacillus massiliamazoniensis]|jgi:menaquinol-cytochrome c reductase cytochrome b/c subunit|uniref:Menaquinol:cytochrome c reductase cytochrome c subunit n=1 Tax=Neobacillus massiliamazoniensis TaxID=1499688 RepID=A0A0U1P1E5_9BACI|nr:menaquinol-cytochrome c reductase cytochrome b/c subunit [Neobacillus massiliamazoniensis]CRK83912.1 menaquinol:cytochrome c oxidoreductase cytochrome cc subunit [Neobacillus massiliamazoniensis]